MAEEVKPPIIPSNDQEKARWHFNFTNRKPSDEGLRKIEALRSSAKALADAFIDIAPYSRERSVALTNLETALFYINAAVARNEPAQQSEASKSKSEERREAAMSEDQSKDEESK